MELTVFLAVLLAAALHAGWNAMVKGKGDPGLNVTAVMVGHIPLAALAILLSPLPKPESWPWIAASILLHIAYQSFLLIAYRLGDLTQVYPIARGSAPILVALISVAFLGVALAPLELAAVLAISAGIFSLVLVRGADGLRNPRAGTAALITGIFIAGYSLVDGLGARLAGTSFGFYGWVSLINGVIYAVVMARLRPGLFAEVAAKARPQLIVGGGISFIAYGIVTWAFTQAPIALVTALRETSIVFALMLGVFFLKERLNLAKLVSTMITVSGAVLLRLARL